MAEARLRIAFVVDRFGSRFGGAEAYGVALMRELASAHDIVVFAHEYDPSCDLRLPFVPLRSWRGWPSWLRVLLFAWRAARRTRGGFDIVHSHMNGWCGDIEVMHVTPVRYNWRVRGMPWFKRLLSRISPRVQTYLALEARRVAVRRGHRAVAVSDLIAQQMRQAYGAALAPPVIPPGVARPAPAGPARRREMRLGFGWDDGDIVCLLVARNPMRKGLPTALKALALLPGRYKLLVVGGDGAAREYLARSGQGGLAGRIHLAGQTSDVDPYYQAADIYVHPTLNDSFAMAPLEAMASGLPVILSPAPWCGFAQYLADGSEALLLSHPENAEQLAQFIERVGTGPALRATLVRGGGEVVERHSWERVARQYMDLYRLVLGERG